MINVGGKIRKGQILVHISGYSSFFYMTLSIQVLFPDSSGAFSKLQAELYRLQSSDCDLLCLICLLIFAAKTKLDPLLQYVFRKKSMWTIHVCFKAMCVIVQWWQQAFCQQGDLSIQRLRVDGQDALLRVTRSEVSIGFWGESCECGYLCANGYVSACAERAPAMGGLG